MTTKKREVKPVVSTNFPDLLGEEEARLQRRENYPSEVSFKRSSPADDLEADGLLDELLNDDGSLTDSNGSTAEPNLDNVEQLLQQDEPNIQGDDDNLEQEEEKQGEEVLAQQESTFNNLFGGLLSFASSGTSSTKDQPKSITAVGSTTTTTTSSKKRVTYAEGVKFRETPTDDTSKTGSDRSATRYEEGEEAIEIVSIDDNEDAVQKIKKQTKVPVINLAEEQEYEENEGDEDDEEEEEEEEDNDDDDEEEEEGSVNSSNTNATQDLLERAHDRLNMQNLYEEIEHLRKTVERKDQELEQITGQLRRAVATKCDLVIAHTELERHHEFNLKKLEEATKHLLRANFGLVEEQASTDIELMNEIVRLNQEMKEMKSLHIQELGDWERLHTNEVREKEFQIAKLNEEIRKLKVGTTVGRKQKKVLGLVRQ